MKWAVWALKPGSDGQDGVSGSAGAAKICSGARRRPQLGVASDTGAVVAHPRCLTARCALPFRAIRRANYVHNVVDTP